MSFLSKILHKAANKVDDTPEWREDSITEPQRSYIERLLSDYTKTELIALFPGSKSKMKVSEIHEAIFRGVSTKGKASDLITNLKAIQDATCTHIGGSMYERHMSIEEYVSRLKK